ncbi:MAG TPA: hypothetical protein VEB68_07170 [Croceibacterium sp.]|nr:hypothetical protein [Croceibacterium sp.]
MYIEPAPLRPEPSAAEPVPMVWLLGQPSLRDYLAFHRSKVIGGEAADARQLTAEWREANDYYYELEQAEAGIADTIDCRPLDRRLARLAGELERNPWFRATFDDLPYTIELVELDKLVVSQLHVENGFSGAIAARLGPAPPPSALFRFCLPAERELPPVSIRRLASNRYQFTSPSSDFREHSPRLLRPHEIGHLELPGPAAAFFGVSVGFGSNFVSGVRSGKRVLLQNGYHRCYALRSAGITHAWCVVEHVTRKDELRLTANETVAEDPEFYFAAWRPPILRDFFDPRIARPLLTRPMECAIEVEIKVRSSSSTAV